MVDVGDLQYRADADDEILQVQGLGIPTRQAVRDRLLGLVRQRGQIQDQRGSLHRRRRDLHRPEAVHGSRMACQAGDES